MSASHQSPKVEASAPSGGETPAAARRESIKPSTLREAYAGTKVFWHAKEKLQIKIIECVPPRGGGATLQSPVIAVLTYSENARVAHAPMFADMLVAKEVSVGRRRALAVEPLTRMRARARRTQLVSRNISNEQLEDQVEQAVSKLEGGQGQRNKQKATASQREQAKMQIIRDAVANVVLLRLKLVDGAPLIEMLSSDKGDSIAERLSMKANPGVTTNELEEFMFEVREEVKFGGAAQELAALKQSMDDAGKETQAAARAQKLLTMSMNALDTLRKTLDNQNQMTGPKARVYKALRRNAVRKYVDEVRVRLESSPSYAALLREQEEKRAARGA